MIIYYTSYYKLYLNFMMGYEIKYGNGVMKKEKMYFYNFDQLSY